MISRRTLYLGLVAVGVICTVFITLSSIGSADGYTRSGSAGLRNFDTAFSKAPAPRSNIGSSEDDPAAPTGPVDNIESGAPLYRVETGSDSYYALPSVRAQLVADVASANDELQGALSEISANPVAPDSEASRGVYVFLPGNSNHFNRELKSFYLSIAVMRTTQPANLKTDLVVFTPPSGMEFVKSLGCTEDRRSSFSDPERCTVVEHVQLKDRTESTDPLKAYGNYVDSMLMMAEYPDNGGFTYIIRSDMDTFLTPGFADWVLTDGKVIATGLGGYGSNNAVPHLKWIGEQKLGLKDQNLRGIGSTWYGFSGVMQGAARVAIASMRWMHTQEFSEFEKSGAAGTESWPHWHWPVLLLYGGHIAINQIAPDKVQPHTMGLVELDRGADSPDVLIHATKHMHCWHADQFFSKIHFQANRYVDMDLTEHAGMESMRAFAGVIAISSDRMTPEEIGQAIASPTVMKEGGWKRLLPQQRGNIIP